MKTVLTNAKSYPFVDSATRTAVTAFANTLSTPANRHFDRQQEMFSNVVCTPEPVAANEMRKNLFRYPIGGDAQARQAARSGRRR